VRRHLEASGGDVSAYVQYQEKTEREIPVVLLEPIK